MMIHPDIHSALARERTRTFLADAETGRLARQLRRPVRPADDGLLGPSQDRVVKSGWFWVVTYSSARNCSESSS
jgi:hypothetical protein